jgi:hypothetical protein
VTDKVEIGLAGAGKTDFYLLKAHSDQLGEHGVLAVHVHGIDQRLIAVAKINTAPARRLG